MIVSPQSPEAEAAVLGGVLLHPAAYERMDWLRAEMFGCEQHRVIFSALRDMYEAGRAIDALLVAETLIARGELEKAGGREYLSTLAANTPSVANVASYARRVQTAAMLREIGAIAQGLAEETAQHGADPAVIAERAENAFNALVER